jgi:hypothetical protein
MSFMGNEFSGLPLDALIGGPLTSACNAQVMLANATQNFINNVGFRTITTGTGSTATQTQVPRQVDFQYLQPVPIDPASSASGPDALVQQIKLSVPLLAIVNVPALMIKSVDITFDMEVKSTEMHADSTAASASASASASGGWGPFSAQVSISGTVSTQQSNTSSTDRSAKYHVEVRARDDGMPEGLSRVLSMLQRAIAPVSIGAPQTQASLPH